MLFRPTGAMTEVQYPLSVLETTNASTSKITDAPMWSTEKANEVAALTLQTLITAWTSGGP